MKLAIYFQNKWYTISVVSWGFLTDHARVLLCIARDPGVRLRDIASSLGITERSAHGFVTDLTAAGYVVARRNSPSGSRPRTPGRLSGRCTGVAAFLPGQDEAAAAVRGGRTDCVAAEEGAAAAAEETATGTAGRHQAARDRLTPSAPRAHGPDTYLRAYLLTAS
jgi:hypothetical protein